MRKNIFIAIVLSIVLLVAGSCKRCDNCLHGGSCAGNGCSCPDPWSGRNCDTSCSLGYEGYRCATFSKEKFYGTWDCTSNDPAGNKTSYQISLTNNPAQPTDMYMSNFNEKAYRVNCTLSGKTRFEISPQLSAGSLHANVSGYGVMRDGKLTLYVTEDGVPFFGTATKQ